MDYQLYFEIAIAIFNENVGSDFTVDNVVLDYLTSDNQKQVFERFCAEYFPYRLKDPYEEEGYFDFYATAFVSKKLGGKDGILLHTDIPYTPAELIHVLLHELAHIFLPSQRIGRCKLLRYLLRRVRRYILRGQPNQRRLCSVAGMYRGDYRQRT